MESDWPTLAVTRDEKIEKDTAILFEVIRTVRNIRAKKNVKPSE